MAEFVDMVNSKLQATSCSTEEAFKIILESFQQVFSGGLDQVTLDNRISGFDDEEDWAEEDGGDDENENQLD